ncbi:peptidoglycan DD-metalloendopeptidase family protein [Altererythrobacter luteolus]|uniref:Peptidoglycan DD-metalloendopeptidase family protein n=1 Tax=Pontixanthobacter luteolus TaxID=295089 RepID=A0A6I4V283_9SPHN|nr:peptidoglycan DD-metalloendopeptidase family protein [Pontixanthobacter luteolus]
MGNQACTGRGIRIFVRPQQESALFNPRKNGQADAAGSDDAAASFDDGQWRTVALTHAQIVDDERPQIIQRAGSLAERFDEWRFSASEKLEKLDLAPDLAESIGSGRWFRGLGTMIALSAVALAMWPDVSPLEAAPAMEIDETVRDEFRSQMIMPLALGADSGRHMGATPAVVELASAPERPSLDFVATLARGDSFGRMLQRAGVGSSDAQRVSELIARSIPLSDIESGTQVDITLGRRPAPGEARPLDAINFRARFDLALQIDRVDGNLSLKRIPIQVDDTPLRIRGKVGASLYRSARAAGAPASAVQQYLSALGDQIDLDRSVRSTDTFDIIIAHRRAATGERQAGKLLYAGVDRGGQAKTQLMRWGDDGRFYEASGVGEQRNGLIAPVPGPISSRFGMRRHPILGYRRMHSGLDFRAGSGTPIVAVTDARVSGAGRMGGCGNAVRLDHGGGLSTRYCHMSRVAVRAGQSVRRGQVIGYVGSTGLSTGPHLHYEMYRNGRAVNPASVKFVTRAQLSGADLRKFREALAALKTVEAGAALTDLKADTPVEEEPVREIDKLTQPKKIS